MDLVNQVIFDCAPEKIDPYWEVYCSQCNQRLAQDFYRCLCSFNLCMPCYDQPQEIRGHWLHPYHTLVLQSKHTFNSLTNGGGYHILCYVCDGCVCVSFGRAYVCCNDGCDFKLCIDCASSTANRKPLIWESRSIFHYSHLHALTRCRYKWRLDYRFRKCLICELPLWGVCYGCVRCSYFVHELCVVAPREIHHPAHPAHTLKRLNFSQDYSHGDKCMACAEEIWYKKPFSCDECDFTLHFKCADSLLRTLKNAIHAHSLLYVPPKKYAPDVGCHACGGNVSKRDETFYRCVQCDLDFHFGCIPIPPTITHKYHMHTLNLVDSFEDGVDICYICETRRKPGRHAYCCEDCKFVCHIECVLSQEEEYTKSLSCLLPPPMDEDSKKQLGALPEGSSHNNQVRHMGHKHPLTLSDPTNGNNNPNCRMCHLEIQKPAAYSCENCEFWLHKECAELKEEMVHPLHPDHSVSLLHNFRYGRAFICNICKDVSDTFCFLCRTCGFIMDVKCAFQTLDVYSDKFTGHVHELNHPIHAHQLNLVNPTGKYASVCCKVCNKHISGLRYCCVDCKYFFHISCFELPNEVLLHPLHPMHTLFLTYIWRDRGGACHACGDLVVDFNYACREDRDVSFHIECALAIMRPLKHKLHEHHLYYFHSRPTKGHKRSQNASQVCSLCAGGDIDESYYRCVECKLDFHLKCLELPRSSKHKWHLHQLTLKDEVDFGENYCDICEAERDFRHPVYCCKDREFVVHIECIASEENASNVVLEEIDNDDGDSQTGLPQLALEEIESDNEDFQTGLPKLNVDEKRDLWSSQCD